MKRTIINGNIIENDYKRKTIPKSLKDKVWEAYNGKVYYAICRAGCGKMLNVNDYECGHVISVKNGGTNQLKNLRPICSKCNKSMGTQNLETFAETYHDFYSMDIEVYE